MAGAKFEYDESGNTFFYFLFSFFALILLPVTYYLWPKDEPTQRVQVFIIFLLLFLLFCLHLFLLSSP